MDNSSFETRSMNPWKTIRQHIRLVVGLTLACAAGAGLFSLFQKKIYRASTYLLLSESKVESSQATIPNFAYFEILRSYELFITSDSLVQKTLAKFGLEHPPYSLTVDEFQKRKILQVEWSKNTRLLEISAEFPDPRLAADIVNYFVDSTVQLNDELNTQDLEKARALLKEQLNVCAQQLESARKKFNEFNQIANLESFQKSLSNTFYLHSENQGELARLLVDRAREAARQDALLSELKNNNGEPRLRPSESEDRLPSKRVGAIESESPSERFNREISETKVRLAGVNASIQALKNSLESDSKVIMQLQKEKASREATFHQLADEYKTALDNYEVFARKSHEAVLVVGSRSTALRSVAPAIPPTRPYKPWIALNTILGGLLGFLVSIPLCLFIHNLKQSTQPVIGPRAMPKENEYRHSEKL